MDELNRFQRRFPFIIALTLMVWVLQVHTASADPPSAMRTSSPDGLWQDLDALEPIAAGAVPWLTPTAYRAARLEPAALEQILRHIPLEFTPQAQSGGFVMHLPSPDGTFARFAVIESPIMEAPLAAKFPNIRTFIAQGIDDPHAAARLDWTPLGFHAQILSPHGAWYIDPAYRDDVLTYVSYFRRDYSRKTDFQCFAEGDSLDDDTSSEDDLPAPHVGETLRTYRLACAATGEYTAFHGGTVSAGMAAITTAVNRVTGILELEVAARLILIANNDLIVYTNGATDPYTNNSPSTMLGENQSNLTSVIGTANFDIGHVFATGGGGVATLNSTCSTNNKARGVTGLSSPIGDPFYVDYVAHEMGHQFGASHTFNSVTSNCNGNRSSSSAFEPGSGSTIQSYSGICGADNLQSLSDPYYHSRSFDQIRTRLISQTCHTTAATGNGDPVVNAGPDYTIPANTPFELTASATDPNGDPLTYCWEQRDLGAAQALTDPDNGASPIIRSFTGTTNPTRSIPRLSNLLNNTFALGEKLPAVNRNLNFRATVRDNRAGGGGVGFDSMVVTVVNTGAAFRVLSPNTPVILSGTQTITWDVAGTNANGINCANVRIRLSTNGGNTFTTTLVESTPNTGSAQVTLPNINTSNARLRVEAVGNIFFDISNTIFGIVPPPPPPDPPTNVFSDPPSICPGGTAMLHATVGAGETVFWYSGAACGETPAGNGSPLAVTPGSTTTYRARARRASDGVVSVNCVDVAVTVGQSWPDMNDDDVITPADIAGFIDVLLEIDTLPDSVARADVNCDGLPNGADIGGFVGRLGL